MAVVRFGYRNGRNLVVLFLVVIGLYVPFSVLKVAMLGRAKPNDPGKDPLGPWGGEERGGPGLLQPVMQAKLQDSVHNLMHGAAGGEKKQEELTMKIKRVYPAGEEGLLNIIVSVNVHDLLHNVDNSYNEASEGTSHPAPTPPKFIIPNTDICKSNPQLKYLVYVYSAPENIDRRNAIRNTWGNKKLFTNRMLEVVFILGRSSQLPRIDHSVVKESELHGDIVVVDIVEDVYNTSMKGVASLEWITSHCAHIHYAIKAGDMTFVNIFEVLRILSSDSSPGLKAVKCLLWSGGAMPIQRDPKTCSKWCVDANEFPGLYYFPQYCAGLAYILSSEVIQEAHKAAKVTPYFKFDDVYVTGLLLKKITDIRYDKLNDQFSLNENEAIAKYREMNEKTEHYFVRITDISNVEVLFKLAVSRLSEGQKIGLDRTILQRYIQT